MNYEEEEVYVEAGKVVLVDYSTEFKAIMLYHESGAITLIPEHVMNGPVIRNRER